MNKIFIITFFLFLTCTISACQTTYALPAGVTPVQATWLYGRFIIPSNFTKSTTVKTFHQTVGQPDWTQLASLTLKPDIKLPVVLYLHGCRGIHGQAETYSQLLISQGYAVFMPDSFQRPGREQCRAEGTLLERVALRTQEVEYALNQIQKISWVDHTRVLLMGFSEGGNTADNWSKTGFAGVLIMGSACTLVGGKPATPSGIPVLAIVGSDDNFRPGLSCNISRDDGISKSIVIQGAGHKVAQYPKTKSEIRLFLRKCCTRLAQKQNHIQM